MWFDGQKLREARLAKGLTQEQLADMAGVEVCTIRNWERGRSQPQSFSLLHQTAESLGRLPEDFVIKERWRKER